MNVAHSLLQSHCLNVQDFLTAHIPFFFHRRYKWIWGKVSGQGGLFNLHIKGYPLALCTVSRRISGNSSSLICQSLHIDFPVDHRILEALCLCKQDAVLRDQVLSAKYQILGRLSLSCCGVNVSADQAG